MTSQALTKNQERHKASGRRYRTLLLSIETQSVVQHLSLIVVVVVLVLKSSNTTNYT